MTKVDLSEFEALTSRMGPECGVSVTRGQLTPTKRAKLDAALARTASAREGKPITTSAIARWLAQEGHDVSRNTIDRHRRKECSCDRSQ